MGDMSQKLNFIPPTVLPTAANNKKEASDKLFKQLLECTQACQIRFGGKTQLATEFDSCVAALCLSLEAVFSHGLRYRYPGSETQAVSTLKHVSEIVAQSLHINSETLSFWPFIKKHLTKHEEERYTILKHIWTDTGRGKAWIRSTLNERSLERYCHTLLSQQKILQEYYEPWAALRDHDKSSMLPNMAAGLASILFAICIDKPELNSGSAQRPEFLRNKDEPVIEAPLSDNKEKRKGMKKKKVARQFISFEDDDSMLSTSVPSCSSSSSSDTNSLGDHTCKTNQDKEYLKQIVEEAKHKTETKGVDSPSITEPKVIRKLSIENSGSRDKFTTIVPETLTPINQKEIGELTPISVEINENYTTNDMLNDNVEAPSDVSAILSVVESKNSEELAKKDEQIELLRKENKSLTEQVKKYLSAIQMLRTDDETVQKTLEGLQLETYSDIDVGANIYENKLVQIAEMHAELMDFNVILQQSIHQKDLLIEKLKHELGKLRNPMDLNEIASSECTMTVNIWIPSAFLTGSGSSSHHVYQIFIRAGNDEWNIYRRYAQFYALHTDLKKLDNTVSSFDFPPKKSIGKKDSTLVEDRRKRLQLYLRKVIAHWPELAHCNSRFLLEQHLSFFKDHREDLKSTKNVGHTNANSSANHSGL